ncbi:peroxisomal membrane protein PEX13-like isoform X2 [Daphnia carinata]|uniref:peroxisomal membrane protein PEX13-like isoform X2 n=1 Tax=Daphnia carinata TaxID=120202 RepID=UPI00257BC731|nr:peroxisomal membrane protein PEX13-like isoform X2 [Daphnia carinata]
MARHDKMHFQCLTPVAIALFFVAFSKTNGASVAVDSKEPNTETGNDSISSGFVDEKLDPRTSGANEYSGRSYGEYSSGYGVTSKPYSNYGSAYSGSAYSGTGNYDSGFPYSRPVISRGAGTNGIYSTGMSYDSAYGAANQGPYGIASGSGSYGVASSYTGPSYGSSSYGVTPAYGVPPAYGYGSGSSYNIPAYGAPPSYGNNVGSSYGSYGAFPHSAYGNNMLASSYGNGYSGSNYGSGSYGMIAGSYGGAGYGTTSPLYSSSYAG